MLGGRGGGELWEKNKVVSKCRAERKGAAGLGDGTLCGEDEWFRFKEGASDDILKSAPSTLFFGFVIRLKIRRPSRFRLQFRLWLSCGAFKKGFEFQHDSK